MPKIHASFEVNSNFTKVPNEIFRPDFPLWQKPGAMRLWLHLLSLRNHAEIPGLKSLAAVCGLTINGLKKNFYYLVHEGYLTTELELRLPESADIPLDAPAVEEDEPKERFIAEEVEAQPKRESTGLSQADRWELIKAAWNKHKPEGYMQLDGRINLPALIAVETQSKRLEVDRDDYDSFIGAVLRGASADEWWSSKNMKLSQVFGFGADLEDKKFENVEKLYRAGIAIKPLEEKPLTAWDDDAKVVAWYRASLPTLPATLRIERITVADEGEAKDLEDWNQFFRNGRPSAGAEMFYYDRLKAKFDSGRLNYSPERFRGAARLYYQAGKPNPIWWTDRYNMPEPPTQN